MTAVSVAARPTAAQFRSRNGGGGLFTESVNQWAGSYLALAGARLGLAPSVLTAANLVLGVAASITVAALAGRMAAGALPAAAVCLPALLVWHLAYSLDCADGQLARVTGVASPAGARMDVLSDVAAQIVLVSAVASVGHAYRPDTPAWLLASFAGTWLVNLVTSILAKGDSAQSLVTSGSPVVRAVKLVRDYGAVVTVVGLVLAFVPAWTIWLMAAFTVVNGLFLLASIVAAGRASLRRPD